MHSNQHKEEQENWNILRNLFICVTKVKYIFKNFKNYLLFFSFSRCFIHEVKIYMIITLILIVLNYSCWINLTKAHPHPLLSFFHFDGWILWTFFVLSTYFYYPKRNMLAVTVTASSLWFRYISETPSFGHFHPLEFVPRVFKFFFFF